MTGPLQPLQALGVAARAVCELCLWEIAGVDATEMTIELYGHALRSHEGAPALPYAASCGDERCPNHPQSGRLGRGTVTPEQRVRLECWDLWIAGISLDAPDGRRVPQPAALPEPERRAA